MNFKNILALFGVMLFGAGLVMAINGAAPTWVSDVTRWTGDAAGSDLTEGGNISQVDVTGVTLTDRWAAYYGEVSGTLNLTDGTYYVYSWTPSTYTGEVCLSTGTAFNFVGVVVPTVGNIDTAWSMTGTDTATNTFTASTCNLDFNEATLANTLVADHAAGAFYTCAIAEAAGTGQDDHAFCTNINEDAATYDAGTADYEVMVPTPAGVGAAGQETYYFYLELN